MRTIENILGIKPMNQEDRTATPMYSAFTDHPDFAPYNVAAERDPADPGPDRHSRAVQRARGLVRLVDVGRRLVGRRPPSPPNPRPSSASRAETPIYEQWVVWSHNGRFNGGGAIQDFANRAQLNRLDWYSAHNWKTPYPGDSTILPPSQVPGANLPADYLGD